MKKASGLLLFLSTLIMMSCASPAPKKEYGEVKKIDFYSPEEQKRTLNEAIQQQLEQSQKPVLYFGAEWCGPCRRFRASLSDPLMREALDGATLIMIDIDSDSENDAISANYDIHAVPTFILLNKDGSVFKRITSAEWDEDVPANIAPVMKEFLE